MMFWHRHRWVVEQQRQYTYNTISTTDLYEQCAGCGKRRSRTKYGKGLWEKDGKIE